MHLSLASCACIYFSFFYLSLHFLCLFTSNLTLWSTFWLWLLWSHWYCWLVLHNFCLPFISILYHLILFLLLFGFYHHSLENAIGEAVIMHATLPFLPDWFESDFNFVGMGINSLNEAFCPGESSSDFLMASCSPGVLIMEEVVTGSRAGQTVCLEAVTGRTRVEDWQSAAAQKCPQPNCRQQKWPLDQSQQHLKQLYRRYILRYATNSDGQHTN